jgi:hypothetical protein
VISIFLSLSTGRDKDLVDAKQLKKLSRARNPKNS